MDIVFQILLALYAIGLGRVPWKYYIPLTIPLLIFAYMAAIYSGASWLLIYTAFILYLFPLAFVIFALNGLLKLAVRGIGGRDARLPNPVRDVILFALAAVILLLITDRIFGLPRAAAYFLGGLVGKEPLRTFDLGYYFAGWDDLLRAVPALAAYLFFLLFARHALYRIGGAYAPAAAATYDPQAPPLPKPRAGAGYTIFMIACVYVAPTLISLLLFLFTGGHGAAEYNALGLGDDCNRVLWADVNRDGAADVILAGGSAANADAYAAALDGRTGATLWFVDLPGEWCSASPQGHGGRGYFVTRRADGGGGEIFALGLATGRLFWRRSLPAGAAVLERRTGFQMRGGALAVPIDGERAWLIDAGDGRIQSEHAPPPAAPASAPHPYLEAGEGGEFFYREGAARLFPVRVSDYFRQFSPYYSLRLSRYRPSCFSLLWTEGDMLLMSMADKYEYGLVIHSWVDALYRLDRGGRVRWELADGRVRDIESIAAANEDLILIIGRGANRRPVLAAVSPRDGRVLWTWDRRLSFWERWGWARRFWRQMFS